MINLNEYFAPSNRLNHIISVGKMMEEITFFLFLDNKTRQLAIDCAYLHDIGYSEKVKDTGFHPYDGYLFCLEKGYDPSIAKIVLLHSGSFSQMLLNRNHLEEIYHKAINTLTAKEKLILDLVSFCDTHINGYGKRVSLSERVNDIYERHPTNKTVKAHMFIEHPYYKSLEEKYGHLIIF